MSFFLGSQCDVCGRTEKVKDLNPQFGVSFYEPKDWKKFGDQLLCKDCHVGFEVWRAGRKAKS